MAASPMARLLQSIQEQMSAHAAGEEPASADVEVQNLTYHPAGALTVLTFCTDVKIYMFEHCSCICKKVLVNMTHSDKWVEEKSAPAVLRSGGVVHSLLAGCGTWCTSYASKALRTVEKKCCGHGCRCRGASAHRCELQGASEASGTDLWAEWGGKDHIAAADSRPAATNVRADCYGGARYVLTFKRS